MSVSVVILTENFNLIGRVPKLITKWMTKFLQRPSNSARKTEEVPMFLRCHVNIIFKGTTSHAIVANKN